MCNDYYIDDERPDESEMMAAHDEYFWHKAQQEQEANIERMREFADIRRKEYRENETGNQIPF